MKKYIPLLSLFIFVISIFYGFYSLMPRAVSNASVPSTEFSTERASALVKEMSKKAHYLGAEEHQIVRNYIVDELKKMGLEVNVEEQEIFREYRSGAKVQNIVAKIEGTDNSKALMLSTHYDSAKNAAIGASDAASGIATILEGVRAYLASGKKPKNDIIILITDAEELGLLGATAYSEAHPLSQEVGLILIFEARGTSGPSYMLAETNGGNKKIIEEVQKADLKYAATTSLMYAISKMIPNNTDLSAFKKGTTINGLSFAFINDHFDYHTPQDSYERMDMNSLEHQAAYMVPLLNYFADADISDLNSKEDAVYFNFPNIGLIAYSYSWIFPLLLLTILAFVLLLVYGVKKNKIGINEALLGFIPFILSLVVSGFVVKYGWELLKIIYPQYNDIPQGFTYNGYAYLAAFSALTLSICFIFYKKIFAKQKGISLMIAPLFIWVVINIGAAFYLKGAAYFIVAVVTGICILSVLVFSKSKNPSKLLWTTLLATPFLIIIAPGIKQLPVTLGTDFMFAGTTIIVLLFGLFTSIISNYKKFKLGSVFFGLAIIAFITASFQSSYTVDRKKPNGVNYVLNIDSDKAFWGSKDYTIDEYTRQFLGDNPKKHENGFYTFTNDAEIQPIKPPTIEIKKDSVINDLRHIDFSITTHRAAKEIQVYGQNDFIVHSLSVNGYDLKKEEGLDYVTNTKNRNWIFGYHLAYKDSIVNVRMTTSNVDSPELIVNECSYDLLTNPNFNIIPRKEYMMQNSYPNSLMDAIILVKRVSLDEK